MSDDPQSKQLNAIVGAALRGLVDSGASDEFVGSFAATHRVKIAELLGATAHAAQSPDLLDLVTQAVGEALAESGVGFKRRSMPATRIYVTVAGKRTSLTVSSELLQRLVQAKGGTTAARSAIQELATTAPPGSENRSGWVSERLLALLAMEGQGGASDARH